jgi:Arc/MetJ-type ribon-helix-helix transcriptional regulator
VTIDLSKDLEKIVHEAVRAGFYTREADVIRDALIRLDQSLPKPAKAPAKKTKRAKPAPAQQPKKPLTDAELDQYMLERGLLSQIPDTEADFDDPDDQLITIKGEPLSETVIRERR